ncbi:hypothetical protein [Sphingomonas sp.]|jgi:hypothetical protein|uniref:hypothetical protein n=1 Tax=Sphingomonas sp. TaxID=28214 RepID=UPI0035C7E96F
MSDEAARNARYEECLNNLGNILYYIDNHHHNVFLYCYVAGGMTGPDLFIDYGSFIRKAVNIRGYSEDLYPAINDLWQAETSRPRWCIMEFLVRDKKFSAKYTYAENRKDQSRLFHYFEHSDYEKARGYFGDKPIRQIDPLGIDIDTKLPM